MNIFLGIPIPPATIHVFTGLLSQTHPDWCSHSGVRWTTEGNHHLTLHFFGPVDASLLTNFVDNLVSYIKDTKIFSLKINKLYNFPKENSDLIAAYVTLSPILANLYHHIQVAVIKHGFSPETRPYLPHITLCRSKRRHFLKMEPILIQDCEFPVSAINLYQTWPTAAGSEYVVLREWVLLAG